jgi:hypothetical protein
MNRLIAVALLCLASYACTNSAGVTSPTAPSSTGSARWLVARNGDILQASYGKDTTYYQVLALHGSAYLRLACPACGWGTSAVLSGGVWTADGAYHQGAATTTTFGSTSDGDLVINFSGILADGLAYSGRVQVEPPTQDAVVATITVTWSGSVGLDRSRGWETFRPVILSSMKVSPVTYDASVALLGASIVPIPEAGWLVPSPVTTAAWGLKGGTSAWKANAPTLDVLTDRSLPVNLWVTAATDPNLDNLGMFAGSPDLISSMSYTLRAYREP